MYLPWNDTWIELTSLPDMGDGHWMDNTRFFSLNKNGGPDLYLLGGFFHYPSNEGVMNSRDVWELTWSSSNRTYNWAVLLGIDPPLSKFCICFLRPCIYQIFQGGTSRRAALWWEFQIHLHHLLMRSDPHSCIYTHFKHHHIKYLKHSYS